MMSLLNAFLFIQAAPTPPPDEQMSTAMIITKGAGFIAQKINNALTPDMAKDALDPTKVSLSTYMFWLFIIFVSWGFFTLVWEAINLVLDAGTEEHESNWKKLVDTGLLKRAFKFFILTSLGTGALFFIYNPPANFAPLKTAVDSVWVNDVGNTGGALTGMMTPINLIVAPNANVNPALDSSITGIIKKNSAILGAFYISSQSRNFAAQASASSAAEQVWKEYHPNGEVENPVVSDSRTFLGRAWDDFVGLVNAAKSGIVGVWSTMILVWMNFGLDVLIVRTLVINAIYLMMAYKIAVLALPVAFVAAYWQNFEGVLKGVIQTMLVSTIALNVMASATAVIVSPDQITAIITQATFQAMSTDAKAAMELYCKKIYAEMSSASRTKPLTKQEYITNVVNLMGDPDTARVFNMDVQFFVPLRVLMMFSILIVLVGKLGTVISDTISGTMSYHR